MMDSTVAIEIAYALPERQYLLSLTVPTGTTAREAIALSGIARQRPEIDPDVCPLGIFGKVVPDGTRLRPGDRVEIYRPLSADPREKRRQLAAEGMVMGRTRSSDRRAG